MKAFKFTIRNLFITFGLSVVHTLESQILLRFSPHQLVTHLEYDSSAIHPGSNGGLLVGARLVGSYAPLTKTA